MDREQDVLVLSSNPTILAQPIGPQNLLNNETIDE
jgi:hypothetical protein